MNLKFRIDSLGQNGLFDHSQKSVVYMLGEAYEIDPEKTANDKEEVLHRIKERFQDILWFTYRTNFPKLLQKKLPNSDSHISDNGWGCMLRSCQMMFAECLKRCYKTHQARAVKPNLEKSAIFQDLSPEQLRLTILEWFLDCEVSPALAPYSIQTISRQIYKNFNIQPGVWLKPSIVLFALQEIHKNHHNATLADLDMEIYLEGTIYLSQVIKKVTSLNSIEEEKSREYIQSDDGEDSEFEVIEDDELQILSGKKLVRCSIKTKDTKLRKSSSENHPFESTIIKDSKDFDKLLGLKWRKSLILYVLAKIGMEKPNCEYIPFIKEILSYPESVGMIGKEIISKGRSTDIC